MINIKVRLVPPTKRTLNGLYARLKRGTQYGLHDSRAPTISSIRHFVPVVTGNLQRSITSGYVRFSQDSFKTRFFSNLYYSAIIDEGLYGYRKRDYLNKGVEKEMPHIINRIETNIVKEWNK